MGRSFILVFCMVFCFCPLVFAEMGGETEAEEETSTERAREHQERGQQLLLEGDYDGAAREFGLAERLTHDRDNLIELARCYRQLGEEDQALEYAGQYLAEPDLTDEERTQAEQLWEELLAEPEEESVEESDEAEVEHDDDRERRAIGQSSSIAIGLINGGFMLGLVGGLLILVDVGSLFSGPDLLTASYVLFGIGGAGLVAGLVWLLVDGIVNRRGADDQSE